MFTAAFICNSPKLETTQTSIKRWADEQIVVYSHNGILFGNKEEWKDDSQNNYAAWKKPNLKKYIL